MQIKVTQSDLEEVLGMCKEELKNLASEKLQDAQRAMYEYACACDLGDERIQAFEFYERLRNVTRRDR